MDRLDFLIIGAAKSATTWLQQSLQRHPDVYMPDPELHYFSRVYGNGAAWYADQFRPPRDDLVIGEKSNSYMDTPEAAARIHGDFPNVRLIAQLRNPVERAYSDYCMLYRRGEVGREIGQYLDPRAGQGGRFLNGGLYYDQLQGFLDRFGSDNLLVLLYENISIEPRRQLDRVGSFLGLRAELQVPPVAEKVKDKKQPLVSPEMRRWLAPFKTTVKPFRHTAAFKKARSLIAREINYATLSEDLKERLIGYYEPQIDKLGTLMDVDLTPWLQNTQIAQLPVKE
ncbi:sulfotransferase family protein [Rhizobium sullae]|uniref:Sulfotransferase domain-containing protein n=1 Tax=Rhizobium sullae TaxID=50338 RepID=A0A4R3Q282_RHISU|nr:sulfotransferase [Rhizobium sullae]TCU15168.1 sulfotransferase domain-containing protein [Rhizobium sullae]